MPNSSSLPPYVSTSDLSSSPSSPASDILDPFLLESDSLVSPPPEYSSSERPSKLPSYLASVLQPAPAPHGAPCVLCSYALVPYDSTSLIVVPPAATLGYPATTLARARFAIRVQSAYVFLYKAPVAGSPSAGTPEAIFSKPIMEASLNRLVRKRDAELDDWRESSRCRGRYRLRSQNGGHTYSIAGGKRQWTADATRCLHLSDPESPEGPALACLIPAAMAADKHCELVNLDGRTPQSLFSPTGISRARARTKKLYNLIGRLEFYHEGVLDDGLEEELVILTCVATHLIHQKSGKFGSR